ncbi:MAG: uroporphyrinogen decarboxylase family protein [Saccharofermentanales bacterium]
MRPKERFEKALNGGIPDDMVAFMELEFHIYEEYINKKPIVGYEMEKLSPKEREIALFDNAEIMVETAIKAGHDAIRSIFAYWEIGPGVPTVLWLHDKETILKQLKALKKVAGDEFYIIGTTAATHGIPSGDHMVDYIMELYDNPENVKKNYENTLKNSFEYCNEQLEAGADTILNSCDVAFNSGPFISPEMMDEFFFPYFNRWVEFMKSIGKPSIWHTDGNLYPVMDRVLESGVTAIQCVDPISGMDIVSLKKEVGNKLTLIGNVNCSTLQTGTKEEITAEVTNVVEGCKNHGGFILSGCNAIFHGIPAENYQLMVDIRREKGRIN